MKKECVNCEFYPNNTCGIHIVLWTRPPFFHKNINKDCKNYKRKWWKFWISQKER